MTDQRPRVLRELGVELERVAAQALHDKPKRPRLSLSGTRAIIALTALAGATTLAIVLISVSFHVSSANHHESQPPALGLDAEFVVLRRPAEPGDRLPPLAVSVVESSRQYLWFGLQLDRSRLIIATRTVKVWLVPGTTQRICLVGGRSAPPNGTTLMCGDRPEEGAIGSVGDTVVGIVPAGSSDPTAAIRDGRATRLTLTDGAFAFHHTPGQLPVNVYFTSPTGTRERFHIAMPPGYPTVASIYSHFRDAPH